MYLIESNTMTLSPRLARALNRFRNEESLNVRELRAGDQVTIQTKRSTYRLTIEDDRGSAIMTGSNPKFAGPYTGRITGSRLDPNNPLIANETLFPQGYLEFMFITGVCPESGIPLREEIVTSAIQTIYVNDVQILPLVGLTA